MIGSQVEREDTFDVEADFVVPDVTALLPPGATVRTRTEKLRSRYFDTADLDLLAAEMTLRRRTGSTDAGWQLKVPHKPAREEIRLPDQGRAGVAKKGGGRGGRARSPSGGGGQRGSVPDELARLLLGVTRGRPLEPVAVVTTERSVHRLLDADKNLLAEIDDDNVHASVGGEAATAISWREVEVELGHGNEQLLAAIGKRLRRAGARPAAAASKLARVLGTAAVEEPTGTPVGGAAGPVLAYLAEQRRVMVAGDLALRRDQAEVIHKTRVAARRLRSTLRTFQRLFEEDGAADLEAELRWYAGLLGEVRDRQVLRARLEGLLDELPEEMVLGPVRARIDTELGKEQTEHWKRLQSELVGQRYLALLDALAAWVSQPPTTDEADKPVTVLPKLAGRANRKVSRRLRRATASGNVELLHSARKAAKRARYAAELIEPVAGKKKSQKLAARYERLQNLLGEHQDSLVSADVLRRLGAKAGTTRGENGFTFGILYERELHCALAVREDARREATRH